MNKILLAIFLLASVFDSKHLKKELMGRWDLCEERNSDTGNSIHYNVCPTIIFKEGDVGIYLSGTKRIGTFKWQIDSNGYLKINNKRNQNIIDDGEYGFSQGMVVKGDSKWLQGILKSKYEKYEYILGRYK